MTEVPDTGEVGGAEQMTDAGRTIRIAATGGLSAALLFLLGAGLFRSELVAPGPGPTFFRRAVLVTGLLTTAALLTAAVRTRSRLRASWSAIALLAALWTGAVLVTLNDHRSVLAWAVLRPLAAVVGCVALALAPGVRRSVRDWGPVVLDGWLVSGSIFLIGWLALYHTGSRWAGEPLSERPALAWIPVDMLIVSVVAGLAMRAERGTRLPVVMIMLVSLLTVTSDCTWAVAPDVEFAVLQWMILMAALAASTIGRLDLWRGTAPDRARPRLVRWPQLAVVPGLAAAVLGRTGPIVAAVAIGVVAALVGQIFLAGRRNAELWQALESEASQLDLILRESRDAIVQVDAAGTVLFANEAASDVLGRPRADLLGHPFAEWIHPADRDDLLDRIAALTGDGASVLVTARLVGVDGTERHLEATVSRRIAGSGHTLLARDVTDRVRSEEELRRLATSDTLTGLLNRHAFLRLLDERLAAGPAAVLFLDLDGFKAVNDSHGHAAGDRLLVEAARALRTVLDDEDVAARLGGDEFAVLAGIPEPVAAQRLATRITDRLRSLPSDHAEAITVSIGVAIGRDVDAGSLLADADLAMYRAKAAGGGRHRLYDPRMRPPAGSAPNSMSA